MAQFVPKTSEQILRDAIDYLYLNTNLSDFNVGSVIRTILEVMALEDANQYYQMINILESFFLKTAAGPALDDRAAEYDVVRLPASASVGEVIFLDTHLQRSFLINDVGANATSLVVEDASVFGGVPFMVQLGEGGGNVEQVEISAIDATTGVLTINPAATPPFNETTYSHTSAATGVDEVANLTSLVCLFNVAAADRIISSGITLRAEPTNVTFEIECMTVEMGTHPNGYFASNSIKVRSNTVGVGSNIPERRLNQIVGGSPYSGAGATNLSIISGGREAESDSELRGRIRQHIAGLSSGTVVAILNGLLTTTDANTGSTVTRARLFEDFDKETVFAYVDDASSSGISGSEERSAQDSLAVATVPAGTSLTLNNITGFTSSTTISNASYVVIDTGGTAGGPFITAYSALLSLAKILDGLLTPLPAAPFVIGTTVAECEVLSLSSEEKRKYYQTSRFPLGDDAFLLYVATGGTGSATLQTQLLPGQSATTAPDGTFVENYIINEATGQIEFLKDEIPPAGSGIFAVYESYTKLIKEAQKVVDGTLNDVSNYPGIRSAGVKVRVLPALRQPANVTLNLNVDNEISDTDTARFLVKQAIISYVNNLDIGEPIIVAEIIERSMGVFGVTNVKVVTPLADQAINETAAWYALDVTVI